MNTKQSASVAAPLRRHCYAYGRCNSSERLD